MKLIPNWKKAHKLASIRIAGSGFGLMSLGAGLALSGSAAQWIGVIPNWAIFVVAAVICASTVIGRIFMRDEKQPVPDA